VVMVAFIAGVKCFYGSGVCRYSCEDAGWDMSLTGDLWVLDDVMRTIAEQVHTLEERRRAFATILHDSRFDIDLCSELPVAKKNLLEPKLAVKVEPADLGGLRVCGVDGGLLKKSLRGLELVITRAVAAIFEYSPSGRVSAKYFPRRGAPPLIKADLRPLSWREADISASLERLEAELQLAIRVQDHHPVDLLLLDGSLLPQLGDRPPSLSLLRSKYQEVRSLYAELYRKADETGTLLAGIVKDSRSSRFVNLLGMLLPHLIRRHPQLSPLLEIDYRSILRMSRDTDLFYRILEVGERSCLFHCSESSSNNEERNTSGNVVCFYLRTAKYDYPLRVEVYTGEHEPQTIVKKVSAILLPLSSSNDEFALPSVLIDADSQARMIERDLEFLYSQIIRRIGLPGSLMRLRRDRMPFH